MPNDTNARAALGGAGHGQGGRQSAAWDCSTCHVQDTTGARNRQDLRANNGRVVATIEGDCLKKQVDGSRHFRQKPAGIAFDAVHPRISGAGGARVVWVRDRETGDVYTCQLADFALYGVKVNRGFGPQTCLTFTFWRVRRVGEPVQLALL